MIGRTLNYISHHAIAILALVCSLLALAGASYAATQLPKNSVGNAQIKQGAVAPPKFSKQIGGYVRLYAKITPAGKIIYASPGAKVTQWAIAGGSGAGSLGRSAGPTRRLRTKPAPLWRPPAALRRDRSRPRFLRRSTGTMSRSYRLTLIRW